MKKIKVVIIDDSLMTRKILIKELSKNPDIVIVGEAPNPIIGRDKIVHLKPDVIILDIEMPKMDGLTFLKKLMKYYPMPVIVLSSLAKAGGDVALKAIEYGALEVVKKPGSTYSLKDMSDQLADKIRGIVGIKFLNRGKQLTEEGKILKFHGVTDKIIVIGASTGGTKALKEVLCKLPANMPPILVVQHMPENFTNAFANRLNTLSKLNIKEASNGDKLEKGKVLIAPGNKHMEIKNFAGSFSVEIKNGPLVYHQRPAVEVLFQSVAKNIGKKVVGVILTGMGKDGAKGLLELRKKGAYTIAQDKESSIVYGMPKEAIEIGAAIKIESLKNISQAIIDAL